MHCLVPGIQKDYSKMLAHRIYTKFLLILISKVLWLLLYIYKQYIFTIHTPLYNNSKLVKRDSIQLSTGNGSNQIVRQRI